MGQQDDRRRTYNLRHGPAKIVAARKTPLPLWLGDLIAKAGDPKRLAVFGYPQRMVFENIDPGRTQGTAHTFGAVGGHSGKGAMPPVVIAENRVDAERRVQNRESLARLSEPAGALQKKPSANARHKPMYREAAKPSI
jgi:hypothetical protein